MALAVVTDELLHGRYRVLQRNRSRPTVAIDVDTGARVLLPEDIIRPPTFLWRADLRDAARAIRERADPRIPSPLEVAPVVVPCPPDWTVRGTAEPSPTLRLTLREAVCAALEVVELIAIAGQCGAEADDWDAAVDRRDDGSLRIVLAAPRSTAGSDARWALEGLRLLARWLGARDGRVMLRPATRIVDEVPEALVRCIARALPRDDANYERVFPVPACEALEEIARFSGDEHAAAATCDAIARWASRGPRVVDFDARITLGEAELAALEADALSRRVVRFHLASVLHRRACLETDMPRALVDARRAAEIDAHPEYLTTLAVLLERIADDAAAAETYDRAVDAIAAVTPPEIEATSYRRDGPDTDYRSSLPSKIARTYECRGAFRVKRGDRDGAIRDLRASLAAHATESARRRLARLAP